MAVSEMSPLLRFIRRVTGSRPPVDVSDGHLLRSYLEFGDETAFTALLQRHGPMVYGVCRRILKNDADADDAFQATFLVLSRRAASIRRHHSLGSWLHGVALRLSQCSRRQAAQRHRQENDYQPSSRSAETIPDTTRPTASYLW